MTHTTAFHAQHHVGRIAIVLNIGLVGNPFSGLTQAQRAKAYAEDVAAALDPIRVVPGVAVIQAQPVTDTVLLLQTFYPAKRSDTSRLNPRGLAVAWSERVTENTDVISFDIQQDIGATQSAETIVRLLTYRLAIGLFQEAIAVKWYDPGARDTVTGQQGAHVIGPQADQWNNGQFNPEYWQPFLNAADNVPARFPVKPVQGQEAA